MKAFMKHLINAGLSEQYANAAWFTLSPRPETETQEINAARNYIRRFNLDEKFRKKGIIINK